MNIYKLTFWRVMVAVLLLSAWQIFGGDLLSNPSEIGKYLWEYGGPGGDFWPDLQSTFQATAIGYGFGAVIGLACGLLLAQSEKAAMIFKPYVLAIYGIPRIALAPVFIAWFGIALLSKVMMAGMVTFMLVFFNTYEGVRSADLDLRNTARVLGANRWQLFFRVTLPNASPWITAGLRIAIPQALVGAVVAEFIASERGLGFRMMENTGQLAMEGVMGGVLILMMIVVILNSILDKVEDYILRWRPKQSDTETS
ncbi:MAG: ABC transporter permease [Alphaproteobacteria bacterium]